MISESVKNPLVTVTALTSGLNDPSTRFRCRQYIHSLLNEEIEIVEYCPSIDKYFTFSGLASKFGIISRILLVVIKIYSRIPGLLHSHQTHITWINRELIPGRSALTNFIGGIKVLDIDDAIWVGSNKLQCNVKKLLKRVDVVLAGNQYLAEWCSKYCNEVYIVPTAIDIKKFLPRSNKKLPREFIVGWTGTKYTQKYLYEIEGALKLFLQDRKDAKLLVISDECPNEEFLRGERVSWVRWSPENEATILAEIDVGIMPLPNNDWTKGKCSFKLIQYMASGIAIIASPVGMNKEILSYADLGLPASSCEEWVAALTYLYENYSLRESMGKAGRKIAEEKFSIDVVSLEISKIFKKISTLR